MQKKLSTLLVMLAPAMMLAACATNTPGISLGTPTVSGKPAVCLSLQPISPNRGKPSGVSLEDIEAVLNRDNPVSRVRNLVGDTTMTLAQVDRANAAITALCGEPAGAVPR